MIVRNAAARDVEALIHPYTNLAAFRDVGPLVLERAQGVRVYDAAGRDYIEGMSGLWCASLGYGNAELVEAARLQMATLPFAHLFGGKSHDPAIELAERLKDLAPTPMSKVLFASSGSEANDTQMKLQWYYNNALGRRAKKKIISRMKGYHGVTVAAASLTGLPNNHIDFDLPIAGVLHVSCPHYYRYGMAGESELEFSARLGQELEALIAREGGDAIAAFIAEPVMAAGGVIVPPQGYFETIQPILQAHDIMLIADEVVTGFGRLGSMFGSSATGMKPDAISLAKALTSAYVPLSAVMIPERMYEAMLAESRKIGTFGHGATYAGHPVAAAVALKTLEIYERDRILERAQAIIPQFARGFDALADHPLVGEARSKGLVGGLELVADKARKTPFSPKAGVGARLAALAQDEGLIVRNLGDTIALCPPLIISAEDMAEIFEKLRRALDRGEAEISAHGLRAPAL